MSDTTPPEHGRKPFRQQFVEAIHYAFAIWVVVLLVLVTLITANELSVPGAPVALFCITIGTGLALALAIIPKVFSRLPNKVQSAVMLGVIVFAVLPLTTGILAEQAWERTPEGAAHAQDLQAQEQRDAAREQRQEEMEAQQQQVQEQEKASEDRQKKLESCFSMFGHRLPDLEKAVRDNLENPRSFEHVETSAMSPDPDGYNVAMKFRAENGFSAIRTAQIRATLDPDTCEITNIESKPEML